MMKLLAEVKAGKTMVKESYMVTNRLFLKSPTGI